MKNGSKIEFEFDICGKELWTQRKWKETEESGELLFSRLER